MEVAPLLAGVLLVNVLCPHTSGILRIIDGIPWI